VKNLLFACLLLGLLRAVAWCDVILPNRTTIAVANLTASPGFKFSYSTDTENQPQKFVPLRETQDIWGSLTIRLFVEDTSGERFEWASVKADSRAKTAAISILEVRRDGKKIKVNYKMKPEPAAGGKPAANGRYPVTPFVLSGFSLGAVVLLMRRKRAQSAGK
jgi:hypothetical protein